MQVWFWLWRQEKQNCINAKQNFVHLCVSRLALCIIQYKYGSNKGACTTLADKKELLHIFNFFNKTFISYNDAKKTYSVAFLSRDNFDLFLHNWNKKRILFMLFFLYNSRLRSIHCIKVQSNNHHKMFLKLED